MNANESRAQAERIRKEQEDAAIYKRKLQAEEDERRRKDAEKRAYEKEQFAIRQRKELEQQRTRESEKKKRDQEYWNTVNGGKGGGCFPNGTKISTPLGMKDISELQVGEYVLSIDQKDNTKRVGKILKKPKYYNRKIWLLEFVDGSFLRTTSEHTFSVNGKWKKASEIGSGEDILSSNNGLVEEKGVKISRQTTETEDVYNIIVDGNFTFIADGVLAHSFTYFRGSRIFLWSIYSWFFRLNRAFKDFARVKGKTA